MRPATLLVASMAVVAAHPAQAGNVAALTTFSAGTPARAAEVNANFAAVKTAVDDNAGRIAALESAVAALQGDLTAAKSNLASTQTDLAAAKATIATLQSQVVAMAASNVAALEPYLTVTTTGVPRALLSGINLQIVNGAGTTETVNGKGNVIIGYDEVRADGFYFCSNGSYTDQPTCEANSGIWATSHKSGSHYLVVGSTNNYSRFGGIVAGSANTSTAGYASVTGGFNNRARAQWSTVSGGSNNTASDGWASVSGGGGNIASGSSASVSGGTFNTASGLAASVSGGTGNTASHRWSSVLGGYYLSTSSDYQTIPALP